MSLGGLALQGRQDLTMDLPVLRGLQVLLVQQEVLKASQAYLVIPDLPGSLEQQEAWG